MSKRAAVGVSGLALLVTVWSMVTSQRHVHRNATRAATAAPGIYIDTSLSQQVMSSEEHRAVLIAKGFLERSCVDAYDVYVVGVGTERDSYDVLFQYFFRTESGETFFPPGIHAFVRVSHDFKMIRVVPGI